MPAKLLASGKGFLIGGGEMGARIRAHDWTDTPLGSIETWPQSLRTAVSMMLNSKFPTYMAWGPDLISFYNDAYRPLLGSKSEGLGRPFAEVWAEAWSTVGPIAEKALQGEASYFENLPITLERYSYPEETWWTFSYSPIREESGGVGGVLCTVYETTNEVKARSALQDQKDHLQALFKQAPGFMAALRGPHHVFEFVNDAYYQLVGHRDLVGKPVREAFPELEGQGFFELLANIWRTGEPFVGRAVRIKLQRKPDAPLEERFVDFVYQPVVDDRGQVTGIFAEGYDVTERVRAEEHQALLIHELNHRVKNVLATVQAVARQTFKSNHEDGTAQETFEARLLALSTAHDLLTREHWEGAELAKLVTEAVAPYRRMQAECEQFDIAGPDLRLSPSVALGLSMALHELGTNAAKYGALSVPSGRVAITWTVAPTDPSHLTLNWQEQGGPPVSLPTRKGFGTRLIERSLARELSGDVHFTYAPTGLVCTISLTLSSGQPAGAETANDLG